MKVLGGGDRIETTKTRRMEAHTSGEGSAPIVRTILRGKGGTMTEHSWQVGGGAGRKELSRRVGRGGGGNEKGKDME